MNLCASIGERTAEASIALVKKVKADLIEHRIDFMEEIENLEKIYVESKLPVIATLRSPSNGGHFRGTERSRVNHLFTAIDAGSTMVDIEIETQNSLKEELIEYARRTHCGVVISFHDFTATPDEGKLNEIIGREKDQGADIGKIVTKAQTIEDCHRVLDLLITAKKEKFPLISFAMGGVGVFTRIAALCYGAPFMYVSAGNPTGPGQLSLEIMRGIREVMR